MTAPIGYAGGGGEVARDERTTARAAPQRARTTGSKDLMIEGGDSNRTTGVAR